MIKLNANGETGCCPRFDPKPWDEKEVTWHEKLFLKDRVRSFLHIPLNIKKVIVKNVEAIQAAGAETPEPLMLMDENSLWGADMYIAVSKEVPGAQLVRLSGTYMTKVFEGHYKNAPKWCREMQSYVRAKDREPKQTYFYYTTCPKCAKAYGKNYTVLLVAV